MTDLDRVEQAVKETLERARKEGFPMIPITGFTIMEWFHSALRDAKDKRDQEETYSTRL